MKGQFGVGDVWTFTAIDAESKLVPTWHIGNRDISRRNHFYEGFGGQAKEQGATNHGRP